MTAFPHLDARIQAAPPLPLDRPPTRAEVWANYHYIYKGFKPDDEITRLAKGKWVWAYVCWFNSRSWRKQPDWKEGDPVIEAGVPDVPVISTGDNLTELVYQHLHRAERTTECTD